jgi:hypothetical protein
VVCLGDGRDDVLDLLLDAVVGTGRQEQHGAGSPDTHVLDDDGAQQPDRHVLVEADQADPPGRGVHGDGQSCDERKPARDLRGNTRGGGRIGEHFLARGRLQQRASMRRAARERQVAEAAPHPVPCDPALRVVLERGGPHRRCAHGRSPSVSRRQHVGRRARRIEALRVRMSGIASVDAGTEPPRERIVMAANHDACRGFGRQQWGGDDRAGGSVIVLPGGFCMRLDRGECRAIEERQGDDDDVLCAKPATPLESLRNARTLGPEKRGFDEAVIVVFPEQPRDGAHLGVRCRRPGFGNDEDCGVRRRGYGRGRHRLVRAAGRPSHDVLSRRESFTSNKCDIRPLSLRPAKQRGDIRVLEWTNSARERDRDGRRGAASDEPSDCCPRITVQPYAHHGVRAAQRVCECAVRGALLGRDDED